MRKTRNASWQKTNSMKATAANESYDARFSTLIPKGCRPTDRRKTRSPCSKAREQDSWTFIQPCKQFLHDGTGYALCCLAHGELAWLFHEPHTGLDDCLRMLQTCFRKRMSGLEGRTERTRKRECRTELGHGTDGRKQASEFVVIFHSSGILVLSVNRGPKIFKIYLKHL